MTSSDPTLRLAELASGLGARVLARHFAIRPPGVRDQWLVGEVLLRLKDTGRIRLFERFETGLNDHHEARRASNQARVDSVVADLRRAGAIRAMILAPQPEVTRRPELYVRLADVFANAHDVARMVAEYGASAPATLTDDGSLLQRAQLFSEYARRASDVRQGTDSSALLEALASEMDESADLAAKTGRKQGRILVLERCYEAAQQLADLLVSRADTELILAFTPVFVRLAALNQELGPLSSQGEGT